MPSKEYQKIWLEKHPGYGMKKQRDRRKRAIELLGGRCIVCGIDDYRCLQIDHVNGGGTKEMISIGVNGIVGRVLKGFPGYQLLCANHNWIKRFERKEH